METAARAGVSFRAETVVAPLRTFKTAAVRKDDASKEDSFHMVHYEKSQRRELDIGVDALGAIHGGGDGYAWDERATGQRSGGVMRIAGSRAAEGWVLGVKEVCRQLGAEQQEDVLEDGNGAPIRVLSPQHNPDGFKAYCDGYIDQVWQHITTNGIKFDTQDGNPLVSCHVREGMTCDRTSRPLPKPSSPDIWGCNRTSRSSRRNWRGRNLLKNSQAPEMRLWCCRCLIFAAPELLESATTT
jgi:hypothetical protein